MQVDAHAAAQVAALAALPAGPEAWGGALSFLRRLEAVWADHCSQASASEGKGGEGRRRKAGDISLRIHL